VDPLVNTSLSLCHQSKARPLAKFVHTSNSLSKKRKNVFLADTASELYTALIYID